MQALINFIGTIVGTGFTFLSDLFQGKITLEVLKMTAIKGMILSSAVYIVPVIFNNLMVWLLNISFEVANDQVAQFSGDVLASNIVQLQGLGAYLATKFQMLPALSIVFSAMITRFALSAIPFVF